MNHFMRLKSKTRLMHNRLEILAESKIDVLKFEKSTFNEFQIVHGFVLLNSRVQLQLVDEDLKEKLK
jgi:hypothetical protein